MRIAIDTNRYSDLARGVPGVLEALDRAERVFVPLPVLGELRAGFALGARAAQNERGLLRFLGEPGVEVLSPDLATTHHYAGLFAQLRRQGTPIPTNDIWIAALALQHDLVLFARDAHFDRIPQLVRA